MKYLDAVLSTRSKFCLFVDGGYSDEDQDSDVGDSEFIESMASLAGGQKK